MLSRYRPAIYTYYLLTICVLAVSVYAGGAVPADYTLDLRSAPWSNIGLAAIAAQLGGLWGFLTRLTKIDAPKDSLLIHFAVDMLAAVIVGIAIVLYADGEQWTVGRTLLAILIGGVASSAAVEALRSWGWGFWKPKI